MKKRIRRFLIIFCVLILGGLAIWLLYPQEPVPKYVFSYAENQDADYPTTMGGEYFARLVEQRSDGRIRILVQHSGERGSESEVVEQLKYGGIDFARISLTELTDSIEELNILQMPYLYQDSEHMWRVLDGEIGNYFLELIEKDELIGLSWYDAGARNFYTSEKPIRKLEDISEMKIRVQESNLMADMVKCLGGIPIKGPYSEVYSLLERSEVQGAENNWPSYEAMEHYEVAKYYTLDEHMRIPEIQICSKHTWEKLSTEDQQLILECAKESAIYQRELWTEQEKEAEKLAIAGGAQVIWISSTEMKKFQQAVAPLYEKYCKEHLDLLEQIIQNKEQ